ncbi:MAG: cytochrome-c peroxidase, partial [Salibacteraceae bacterium]
FSEQEARGYQVFQQHCNACHTEPLFTNFSFENNGLPVDTTLNDWGRYAVTQLPEDSLKFKVPSLRNLRYTFPYMHDGRFENLREVLRHYEKGMAFTASLSEQLREGVVINDVEKSDLLAFLLTLNDESFVFNPEHQYPKEIFNQSKD